MFVHVSRSKHPGRCPSLPLARSSLPSFPPSLPTLFISVIPHPPPPPPFTHEAYSKLLSSCAPHCRRTAEIKRAHRAGKKTSRSLWPPRSRFAFLLWLPEGLSEPHHLLAALSKKEKTFFPSPQEKGCGSPEKTAPFQPAHQKSPVSPAGRHRLYGTQVDLKIPGDLQKIRGRASTIILHSVSSFLPSFTPNCLLRIQDQMFQMEFAYGRKPTCDNTTRILCP
ncbi:uncharacterized protein LOC107983252 [Anolis carolinensis]|uniref:uncharacterized protein LOC107983252 n=1 Tax=Anolis carolinensis TaxID=28377 RepID=UPI002F2B3115